MALPAPSGASGLASSQLETLFGSRDLEVFVWGYWIQPATGGKDVVGVVGAVALGWVISLLPHISALAYAARCREATIVGSAAYNKSIRSC